MQEELELEILKNITNTQNQKSMAQEIGYSVGKVNYVLKALIEKGLVKSEKFLNFIIYLSLMYGWPIALGAKALPTKPARRITVKT